MNSEYAGSGNRPSPASASCASASIAAQARRPLTPDTIPQGRPLHGEMEYPRSMSETPISPDALWSVEWRDKDQVFTAIEPTDAEIAGAASELAGYYSDAHNRRMMAHEEEAFTAEAVAAYYRELREEGGRPFLLRQGAAGAASLVGDGD